jgi:hypothetical protein
MRRPSNAGSVLASCVALILEQEYQVVTGPFDGRPVADGRLRGAALTFVAGGDQYTGRVRGDTIEGTVRAAGQERRWRATRKRGLAHGHRALIVRRRSWW